MTENRYRIVAPEHEHDFQCPLQGNRFHDGERPSLIIAASRDEPPQAHVSELAAVGPSPDF